MIETYAFAMRTLFLKVRIHVCGTHILYNVGVRTELRLYVYVGNTVVSARRYVWPLRGRADSNT